MADGDDLVLPEGSKRRAHSQALLGRRRQRRAWRGLGGREPRGRAPGSEPKKLPGGSARKTLSSITAEEEANMPELHMALQAAAARQ